MDYFNDVLSTFEIEILRNCVLKMNKGLMGFERHEGAYLMTEFSFWGELSF